MNPFFPRYSFPPGLILTILLNNFLSLTVMASDCPEKNNLIILADSAYLEGWVNIKRAHEIGKEVYRCLPSIESSASKAEMYQKLGYLFMMAGDYPLSIESYTQSLNIHQQSGDSAQQIKLLQYRGYIHFLQDHYGLAIDDYSQGLAIWKAMENQHKQATGIALGSAIDTYCNLMELFGRQKEQQEFLSLGQARQYDSIAQILIDALPDSVALSPRVLRAKQLSGRIAFSQRDFEKAAKIQKECSQIAKEMGSSPRKMAFLKMVEGVIYLNWGDSLLDVNPIEARQKWELARAPLEESLSINNSLGNPKTLIEGLINIGGAYKRLGLLGPARDSLERGLVLAEEINARGDLVTLERILSQTLEEMGETDAALFHHKKFKAYQDAVFNEESDQRLKEAEVQFGLDLARQRLKAEQWRSRTILASGILLSALLILVVVYYYQRNRARKRELELKEETHSLVMVDLVKTHERELVDTRQKSEAKERKRIGNDLHDQLGGTLTATRFKLEGMAPAIPVELSESFDSVYSLVAKAGKECREFSHALAWNTPVPQQRLNVILEDLCRTLDEKGRLEVHFDYIEEAPLLLPDAYQREIYKMGNELMTNVAKYARAKYVHMQLSVFKDNVSLLVEDNGIGFDYQPDHPGYGLGLSGIKSRARSMGGHEDIASMLGRGTSVSIHIPNKPLTP